MCVNSVGFEVQIEKKGDRGTIVFTAILNKVKKTVSYHVCAGYPPKVTSKKTLLRVRKMILILRSRCSILAIR